MAYYLQLMSLSSIPWLRQPLFEGIVTSAGAGSETILLASRAAIVQTMEELPLEQRATIWDCLLNIIQIKIQNERLVIPVLEVLGFLLSTNLDGNTLSDLLECVCIVLVDYNIANRSSWRKVSVLVQRCHFKTGNLHKVKAAIDAYIGLSRCLVIRKEVLLKLSTMLLHPSPSVSGCCLRSQNTLC